MQNEEIAMITVKIDNNEKDWHYVREEVFMKEQGFHNEFDETDDIAVHLTIYVNDEIAGCARCSSSSDKDTYIFGRIALIKKYRNLGLGAILLQQLEKIALHKGAKYVVLDAQCRAAKFYEKSGFYKDGEIHMDEHVEHVQMKKDIK